LRDGGAMVVASGGLGGDWSGALGKMKIRTWVGPPYRVSRIPFAA
jgi:hypothetical protein